MNARTLIALSLAACTGCTIDNYASVVITSACFPPTPNDDGSCSYPSKCDAVMLGDPWVDTTYAFTGGTLEWPFQLDNQRPDNKTPDGATTTSTAYVTGYKLKYDSAAVVVPDTTVDSTTQSIPPVGTTVVIIPVVPPSVATVLSTLAASTQVRVQIRAVGHYGDGTTLETGPFSMVVNVENGRGSGVGGCTGTTVVVGACPQPGQSNIQLCK